MNVGLDTSVVLRLLVGRPEALTAAAVAFLNVLHRRGDVPVVSDLVAAETYFALQFHYEISKGDALSALREMFAGREIRSTGHAAEVLEMPGLAGAKPGFVDRLIHAAYTEDGGAMATFEKAGAKLGSVTVLK